MTASAEKWDRIYARRVDLPPIAGILTNYDHLIPHSGSCLDLAGGLGANSLYLARRGLSVTCMDISRVAMDRLSDAAATAGLQIQTEVRDVAASPPAAAQYDMILVCRFLHRSLCPAIARALKSGGLLFYQTFTRDMLDGPGPSNPDYLLEPNELLQLFPSLRVRIFRDEGLSGESLLIAVKAPFTDETPGGP